MTAKKLATAAVGAAVALLIANAALAQAAPPKPAATTGAAVPPLSATPPAAPAAGPQIRLGAPIPGICTYSRQAVVSDSMVGKAVAARLQQLQSTVESELKTESTAIDAEQKAIQTAAAAPGADSLALQQRQDVLQARYNAFQRKAQVRDRELQLTEQKAVSRVLTEAQPFAITVLQSRNCSILLNSDAVLLPNPAMDITGDVVKGLNGKIQTLTFDRERLDQQVPAPTAPPVAAPPKK